MYLTSIFPPYGYLTARQTSVVGIKTFIGQIIKIKTKIYVQQTRQWRQQTMKKIDNGDNRPWIQYQQTIDAIHNRGNRKQRQQTLETIETIKTIETIETIETMETIDDKEKRQQI